MNDARFLVRYADQRNPNIEHTIVELLNLGVASYSPLVECASSLRNQYNVKRHVAWSESSFSLRSTNSLGLNSLGVV